jgi:hypothetical protein
MKWNFGEIGMAGAYTQRNGGEIEAKWAFGARKE